MASLPQRHLFCWREIEAASDLERLVLVLEAIPDEPLMGLLEKQRDRGRNEYPVRAVWNSVLAGVVFQHPCVAALRRELRRNAELREMCGFDPLLGEAAVPTDSAYSNFLASLMEQEEGIRALFDGLIERLRPHLPDLGKYLAADGKGLRSFGRPQKKEKEEKREGEDKPGQEPADASEEPDRRGEHDADWGIKTYRGQREDGTTWEKVVRWFGFELHLLVDSKYELPIHYKLTRASAPETTELVPLVKEFRQKHPELIANAEQLAADKGYDSTDNNQLLYDEYRICPIIDKREDWKDPAEPTRAFFEDRVDTVVYDVKGRISCICPATGNQRPMAPWGFEKDRRTLKYRCPAVVDGLHCEGRERCPGAQGAYGKVVRIPIEKDRRMFTPVARDSAAWKRAYDRRTAVERVNSRLDRVLGFEYHTIRGLKKMETRVGVALVVLLAMALGRIAAGQPKRMRSLLAPVRRAAA